MKKLLRVLAVVVVVMTALVSTALAGEHGSDTGPKSHSVSVQLRQ